jgi:hypothetical protein
MSWEWHRPLEAKQLLLAVLSFVLVTVGGLVLLIPPYFLQGTIPTILGVKPYSALELEGRDLYIREGCNTCHSQQVRPFKTETVRYGPFSMAGEGIYDRPFLGSRRTGPDLARGRQVSGFLALAPPGTHAKSSRARTCRPSLSCQATRLSPRRKLAVRALGRPTAAPDRERRADARGRNGRGAAGRGRLSRRGRASESRLIVPTGLSRTLQHPPERGAR